MHRDEEHAPPEEFQRQTRDLFIPVGDIGFWQGAFRDTAAAGYPEARKAIEGHTPWTVELLYGDHEGGQRAITRFFVLPVAHHQGQAADAPPGWLASTSRHWSIDGPNRRLAAAADTPRRAGLRDPLVTPAAGREHVICPGQVRLRTMKHHHRHAARRPTPAQASAARQQEGHGNRRCPPRRPRDSRLTLGTIHDP